MSAFLFGVPGKIKAVADYLTTYLSSTRAAKIDNLDAAVSTRAPAASALTSAMWTDTRAAKLDNIGASMINSIQHGSTNCNTGSANDYTGTTTITAVNLSKSVLVLRGFAVSDGTGSCYATLTNTTTVTAGQSGSYAAAVYWSVIEFK